MDGDGLFLKVDKRGGASWLLRVQHRGKRRDIGLGAKIVSLAQARWLPGRGRRSASKAAMLSPRSGGQGGSYHFSRGGGGISSKSQKSQWTNGKHADQWLTTLERYAFPSFGSKPVGEIKAGDIIAAISGCVDRQA